MYRASTLFILLMFMTGVTSISIAQEGSTNSEANELAKATANPIANITSFPIQLNFNFGLGEYDRTQTLVNLMPVIPFKLSKSFNVINRIILPIINQPDVSQESGNTFGLGDINYSMFLTPTDAGKVIWGIGPAFNIPTRTSNLLGSPEFGIGPGFVVLTMPGNWAFGLTANNVWSYENGNLNSLFSQIFIVYTFPSAWFVNFQPTITSNWNAPEGEEWQIPLSFNVGKMHIFGKQPVKLIAGGSYFVKKPSNGPDWQINLQAVFIFPKGK
jgi:hypothetical protein